MGQSEGKNVCFIQSKEKAMKRKSSAHKWLDRAVICIQKVVTAVKEPYRGRAAGAEWKITSREVEVPYKFFSRSVINFSDTSKSYCLGLNSLNVIHFIIITLQKFYDDDQENAMHRYLDFRNSEASVCEPFKNWTCVHTKWRSSQIFAMLMNFLF